MALDPICKMEVPEKEKGIISVKHGKQTFYFCSDSCKTTFLKDPSKFQ